MYPVPLLSPLHCQMSNFHFQPHIANYHLISNLYLISCYRLISSQYLQNYHRHLTVPCLRCYFSHSRTVNPERSLQDHYRQLGGHLGSWSCMTKRHVLRVSWVGFFGWYQLLCVFVLLRICDRVLDLCLEFQMWNESWCWSYVHLRWLLSVFFEFDAFIGVLYQQLHPKRSLSAPVATITALAELLLTEYGYNDRDNLWAHHNWIRFHLIHRKYFVMIPIFDFLSEFWYFS